MLGLPFSIWALSFSSFLLNCASVIVFCGAPIFMTQTFTLTEQQAGILEGTVEGFALTIRALTGMFSDFMGKRKGFLVWGFSLSALSRFLLAPAQVIEMVILSRYIDRLSNGMQASPREAFISDVMPKSVLGRGFGLNKALGMAGSFMGSLLMLFLFIQNKNFNIRTLLWIASFLSLVGLFVLIFGVKEHTVAVKSAQNFSWKKQSRIIIKDIQQFSSAFWKTLGIICLFKLGWFSGVFLMNLLKNSPVSFLGHSLYHNRGLSYAVFLIIQNLGSSIFSYPLGRLSDKIDRRLAAAIGFGFMMASLLCFTLASSSFFKESPAFFLYGGVILYGLQWAIQGALFALMSVTMPPHLYGTGFGIFFLSTGLTIIFTNHVFMGYFVSAIGYSYTFLIICGFIFLALLLLLFSKKNKAHRI